MYSFPIDSIHVNVGCTITTSKTQISLAFKTFIPPSTSNAFLFQNTFFFCDWFLGAGLLWCATCPLILSLRVVAGTPCSQAALLIPVSDFKTFCAASIWLPAHCFLWQKDARLERWLVSDDLARLSFFYSFTGNTVCAASNIQERKRIS